MRIYGSVCLGARILGGGWEGGRQGSRRGPTIPHTPDNRNLARWGWDFEFRGACKANN